MNHVTRYAIAYLTTDNANDTRYDQTMYDTPRTAETIAWGIAHGYLRSLGVDTADADAAVTEAMHGYRVGEAVTVGHPVTGAAAITVMVVEQELPAFLFTDSGVESTVR